MRHVDTRKLASATAAFYVQFFVGGVFAHYFITGETYTLKYSLTLPRTWIAAIFGLLISYGLWGRFRWPWWLGLFAVGYQIYGITQK